MAFLQRFDAIEGLRAWLAWIVVAAHVVQIGGLTRLGFPVKVAALFGDGAVQVFVIVSGFVIAHLLLTKPEPYYAYMTRRFFRLFPVLVVCSVLGYVAIAFAANPWPADVGFDFWATLEPLRQTQEQHLAANVIAHLTMLHGAIPGDVLPLSQYAFLPPAWSVSLEWQFYLVAPLALGAIVRYPSGGVIVAGAAVLGLLLYRLGTFGSFQLPSFLPGLGYLFLIGVASRLICTKVRVTQPFALGVAGLGLGVLLNELAIGAWLGFFSYLFCDRSSLARADAAYVGGADFLFASRTARKAGARTYSVYLVHYPVLIAVASACALAGLQAIPVVGAMVTIVGGLGTFVAAEIVHRLVERPGIQLGAELVGKRATRRTVAP